MFLWHILIRVVLHDVHGLHRCSQNMAIAMRLLFPTVTQTLQNMIGAEVRVATQDAGHGTAQHSYCAGDLKCTK